LPAVASRFHHRGSVAPVIRSAFGNSIAKRGAPSWPSRRLTPNRQFENGVDLDIFFYWKDFVSDVKLLVAGFDVIGHEWFSLYHQDCKWLMSD
jgi:hypothetical protein